MALAPARLARAAGEGYGEHRDDVVQDEHAPPFLVALAPIATVLILNLVLSRWVIPALDHSALATEKFKHVELKKVLALWAIIGAMAGAIIVVIVANRRRLRSPRDAISAGTVGSLLPMANTASEVGYGAVIAALASFALVSEGLRHVAADPVVSLWLVVTVLAAMTGSASGGMSLALGAMGKGYAEAAAAAHIDPAIMHRIASMGSAALEILPHNGAVITLLTICGLTHKESYFDLFIVGSLTAFVASLVVLGLYLTVGVF